MPRRCEQKNEGEGEGEGCDENPRTAAPESSGRAIAQHANQRIGDRIEEAHAHHDGSHEAHLHAHGVGVELWQKGVQQERQPGESQGRRRIGCPHAGG